MKSVYDPIKLKRVYDEVNKGDGKRLLADRMWPRGIKKSELEYDEWIKQVCPSVSLRKKWHQNQLSYSQFSEYYNEELDGQQYQINWIADMAKKHSITLLSAVKDIEKSHLPILKHQILRALEETSLGNSSELSSPVCYEDLR